MVNEENSGISDDELIRKYQAGDSGSFDKLYARYSKPLYAYLNRLVQHGALADDLFQQTWIRAIGRLDKYESRSRFFAWLTMIAHNLAMDQFRKESVFPTVDLEDESVTEPAAPVSSLPWKEMHNEELRKAIEAAEQELAPELREVFILRCKGVSFKEIAEVQKCSVNTALGRMNYALKNLRRKLAEWI